MFFYSPKLFLCRLKLKSGIIKQLFIKNYICIKCYDIQCNVVFHFCKILTAGLLGEQYVGFEGGAEDKPLAPGATLKLTQSAVVLEKLISQFMYNKAAEGSGSSK